MSSDNRPAEEVAGYCPACGKQSLRLMAEGHVTCCRLECPHPDAASQILHDPETEHIVWLSEDEFTIRHPLRDRLADELLSCQLHKYLAAGAGPPFAVGKYRVSGTAGSRRWEGLPS